VEKESVLVASYKERFIWLDGEINPRVAYRFKRMLAKLNKLKTSPIIFYVRGPGGNPHSTFFMMSEIVASSGPVAVVAHGLVNSGSFTITQAGAHRLALPGTKFTFHPAEGYFKENSKGLVRLGQDQFTESLRRLMLIDAIQLSWFFKKGRPTKVIFDLFRAETTLSLPQARKLHIIDDYYNRKEFLRDRRIARKLIKAKL